VVVDLLSIYEIVFKGSDRSDMGIDLVIGESDGEALTIQLRSDPRRFEVANRSGNVAKGGLTGLRFATVQPAVELTLPSKAAKQLGLPAVSAHRIVGVDHDRIAAFAEHAHALLTRAGVSVSSPANLTLEIAEQESRNLADPRSADKKVPNVVLAFVNGHDATASASCLREILETRGYAVSALEGTSFSVTLGTPAQSVTLADVVAEWYGENVGRAALEISGTGLGPGEKQTVFPRAMAIAFGSSVVRSSVHRAAGHAGLMPTNVLWETRQIV